MKMKLVMIPIVDGVCDVPDIDCLVLGLKEVDNGNNTGTVHAVAVLMPME